MIYGIGYSHTKIDNIIRENIYKKYMNVYLNICNNLNVKELNDYRQQKVIMKSTSSYYKNIYEKGCRYLSALYCVIISGNYVKIPVSNKHY